MYVVEARVQQPGRRLDQSKPAFLSFFSLSPSSTSNGYQKVIVLVVIVAS